MKNYFKVLLQGCLKVEKGDKLFVSLSYKDKALIDDLLEVSYGIGIDDILIDYYENNDRNSWGRYIENGAKFLFLVGDNFTNTFASRILNGFRTEDIGIDYLAAPTYEVLSRYVDASKYISDDALISFSKDNSGYNKRLTTFKNYKFNEFLISSLTDVKLRLDFNNDFKYCRTGVINLFPYYGIDLIPYNSSVNGYIDASMPTFIDGEKVDGLRLSIERSSIVDFDSDNNHEVLKETFKRRQECKVESISIIGSDTPLHGYSGTNDVLEMSANSYITLTIGDSKKIYVPIESKSLSILGMTNSGSKVKVYDKERILIFQ